jgi:hypothetical protein
MPGMTDGNDRNDQNEKDFEDLAGEERVSLVFEFLDFLRYNKKWWLGPILGIMLLFGALVLISGTPLAPLIYTMF